MTSSSDLERHVSGCGRVPDVEGINEIQRVRYIVVYRMSFERLRRIVQFAGQFDGHAAPIF